MNGKLVCLTSVLLAAAAMLSAQIPSARDVVKPVAYASFDPAARGKQLDVAVLMKI